MGAAMAKVEITNASAAPRGLGLATGEVVMIAPGETKALDLTDAEIAELDGGPWAIKAPAKAVKTESGKAAKPAA